MIVQALAPAKINLGLEILGRRDDGFHEIRTILASVSLFDRLRVTAAAETSLRVNIPDLDGDGNLVLRAVEQLRVHRGNLQPSIELRKRIPVAAGLGGASSDAAATLLACDLLYGLCFTHRQQHLVAARLGSDVPFFLTGGLALASGTGASILPLPAPPRLFAVIVAPQISIPSKTATMYRALQSMDFSDGERIATQIRQGFQTINQEALSNAFERPLYEIAPWLREIPLLLRKHGGSIVGLSGAGPAHYALEQEPRRAHLIASLLRSELRGKALVHVARLIPHGVLVTVASDRNASPPS